LLSEEREDTDLLVKARHTLARFAVRELGLQPGDLPAYKAPPPKPVVGNARTAAAQTNAFDVYSGNRFDGQSAAAGTNLGAPANWQSKTERELSDLKQREEKIRRELMAKAGRSATKATTKSAKAKPAIDRQWTVVVPGQKSSASLSSLAGASAATTTSSSKGDSQLLATRYQQQHASRVATDNKGFTTKAMRDLEKLKKTRVYSHTQLAIAFPDGISVKANFGTTEKLRTVMEGLRTEVLFSTETLPLPAFELYQTPPRRVLDPTKTMSELGLVPASKVYVSWEKALPKTIGSGLGHGWYLKQELLSNHGNKATATTTTGAGNAAGPALPTSAPVVGGSGGAKKSSSAAITSQAKRKKTKEEKQAAMLKRMMGGM